MVSRLVGVTLVVVRYLLRVRVFGRILSSTRSPLFFSVPLQSPLSSRGAVSLCLMLLSLALCVPRFAPSHPLLFMPVFLCRPLKLLPRLLMNVAFGKTRAEYVGKMSTAVLLSRSRGICCCAELDCSYKEQRPVSCGHSLKQCVLLEYG